MRRQQYQSTSPNHPYVGIQKKKEYLVDYDFGALQDHHLGGGIRGGSRKFHDCRT